MAGDTRMEVPRNTRYGWQSELKNILVQHNQKAANRNKLVGTETKRLRERILFAGFRELQLLGYRIQHPANFREEHMRVLARHWEGKGQTSSTIQNKISIFRVFAGWIGKPGMIRDSQDYVERSESVVRCQIAREDKSWVANGVSYDDILARITSYDERAGAQLRIIKAFGLRRKEAVTFKPFVAEKMVEGQPYLVVEFGTKGGRPRAVPIETVEQIEALEHAKRIARTPLGHIGWPDLTLEQAVKRFTNIMQRHGVTRKEMGVTAHGLRHEYANDKYERDTGGKSPVRGGQKGEVDPGVDKKARIDTSEALGHSRLSVTPAYYGSHGR